MLGACPNRGPSSPFYAKSPAARVGTGISMVSIGAYHVPKAFRADSRPHRNRRARLTRPAFGSRHRILEIAQLLARRYRRLPPSRGLCPCISGERQVLIYPRPAWACDPQTGHKKGNGMLTACGSKVLARSSSGELTPVGLRALLVDDSPEFLTSAMRLLGFLPKSAVHSAGSGKEAIAELEHCCPNVLFLSGILDMDGLKVVQRAKQCRSLPSIVILSSSDDRMPLVRPGRTGSSPRKGSSWRCCTVSASSCGRVRPLQLECRQIQFHSRCGTPAQGIGRRGDSRGQGR
jgi:CheY-like chemotaxis protein